jgi:ketosteroid isomerase-like protein
MHSDRQPARWLADFHDALVTRDKARLQALFADECYWRDFPAVTWEMPDNVGKPRRTPARACPIYPT